MFDFLKKKISGFVDKLIRKEETKEKEEAEVESVIEKEELIVEKEIEAQMPEKKSKGERKQEKEKRPEKKAEPLKKTAPEKKVAPKPLKPETKTHEPKPSKPEPVPETKQKEKPAIRKPEPKSEPVPQARSESKSVPVPQTQPEPILQIKSEPIIGKKIPVPEKVLEEKTESETLEPDIQKPEKKEKESEPLNPEQKPETPQPEARKPQIKEKEIETPKPEPSIALPKYKEDKAKKTGVSLSPFKAIKSLFTREVEIAESDVHELLENLELEMLEGDVELGVAEGIRLELTQKLVGAKVKKEELNGFVKNAIRDTLIETMSSGNPIDLIDFIASREKPVKIVFLGINGAGKTTTIAKVAHLLLQSKHKVVFAAADTFRAAAIEQMEVHAGRLGVKTIKRDYGSDPTSVAFDAVTYAKAHGIDAVLIDTAGRQDTNVNLINELKKMDRVIKPDLKIYIGESIAGSAIIEQVSAFSKEIGVDGVILTKLDCDPKGGTVLSITKATGIPVIYIGTGQKYEDLERFDAKEMVERILS